MRFVVHVILAALLSAGSVIAQGGNVSPGAVIDPFPNTTGFNVVWQIAVPDGMGGWTETGTGVIPPGGNFTYTVPNDPALCGTSFRLVFVVMSTPPVPVGPFNYNIVCP